MSSQELLWDGADTRPCEFEVRVWVDDETAEYLRRDVKGDGGFQGLMRSLQKGLADYKTKRGTALDMTMPMIEKLSRYAKVNKGRGGFQSRMRPVVDTLRHIIFKLGELD